MISIKRIGVLLLVGLLALLGYASPTTTEGTEFQNAELTMIDYAFIDYGGIEYLVHGVVQNTGDVNLDSVEITFNYYLYGNWTTLITTASVYTARSIIAVGEKSTFRIQTGLTYISGVSDRYKLEWKYIITDRIPYRDLVIPSHTVNWLRDEIVGVIQNQGTMNATQIKLSLAYYQDTIFLGTDIAYIDSAVILVGRSAEFQVWFGHIRPDFTRYDMFLGCDQYSIPSQTTESEPSSSSESNNASITDPSNPVSGFLVSGVVVAFWLLRRKH